MKKSTEPGRPLSLPGTNSTLKNQQGMILISALLILTVLTTMATSTLDLTLFDGKLVKYYKSDVRASYIADGVFSQVIYWFNNPSEFTDTAIGTYHSGVSTGDKGTNFFTKRRVKATTSYIDGTSLLSQFTDVNDDGTSDTSADDPALEYDESDLAQKNFLDTVFSSLSTYEKISNLKIYAPSPLTSDVCTIQITIKSPFGTQVKIEGVLAPNTSFKLDGGVQSGMIGSWNGNSALVHWSDIKITGNAVLPAQLNKTPRKNATLAPTSTSYPGTDGEDAWMDIYVQGTVSGPAGGDGDSQPYDTLGHENIYQNQLFTVDAWDYADAKKYAKKFGTYYTTDAAGNLYLNGSGGALDFKTVSNTTYGNNKGFVFVDTTDQQTPRADGTNLANITFSGGYYTEGKFYIGANLTTSGLGNGETVANAKSPPFDPNMGILHGDSTLTNDPDKRVAIAGLKANFNGAFYVAGHVDMQGGPNLFGGIVAEQGYIAGGNPEVWYDYDLKDGGSDDNSVLVRYWKKY